MRIEFNPYTLERKIEQAFRSSVIATAGQAVKNAPVREGTLRRSITFKFTAPLRALVGVMSGPASKYAAIQEHGGITRPHVIEPRRAKALSWPGAEHPVRKVNHPGSRIPGKHYLRRAQLDVFFPKFIGELRRLLG